MGLIIIVASDQILDKKPSHRVTLIPILTPVVNLSLFFRTYYHPFSYYSFFSLSTSIC